MIRISLLLTWIVLFASAATLKGEESREETLLEKEAGRISAWGRVPELVRATRDRNARNISIETIRVSNLAWIYASKETARMRLLLNNECAKKLQSLIAAQRSVREAMVMDNQGALVCITRKTVDYWQGDKDKWLKAFNEGQGLTFISEPMDTDSTGATLTHISVPVLDSDATIGVISVSLDLSPY